MKNHNLYTLFFGIFIFSFTASADILRVNSSLNTDVSQKLYKTINEAVSAATAGDTLMIEGSSVIYSTATIKKSLVLIGPGYFLTENSQTQANGATATMQQITIESSATGTILEGLTFSKDYNYYAPYVEADNVIISRCYCPNPIQTVNSINNLLVLQNYFVGNAIEVGYSYYTFNNVLLKNNYVGGVVNIPSDNQNSRIFSSVENNVFAGNIILTATAFRSNIITSSSATVTITSANIQNNLVAGTQLSGNGNQTYNSSQLFINADTASTDGKYKLQANSPYLTAGYNGTQPGIFGGSEPYVLSGIPPVPSIYEFNADNIANKQTGLSVEIKAKANQ
ncbi:MAG TPA: hypothetical protein VFW07_24895 [Parafilimonas sp.]|nr:hypothetical protein [Parafilimonas sp.]